MARQPLARLGELRALVDQFEQRRARAAERALAEPAGRFLYFAVLGFDYAGEALTLVQDEDGQRRVWFQRVTEPPGEIELSSALKDGSLFGAVARYCGQVQWELAIDTEILPDRGDSGALGIAWYIVAALRVRTSNDYLVPIAADRSWSVLAGITDHSASALLIEDIPRAHRLGTNVPVTPDQFTWVDENLITFVNLGKNPGFHTAVEAANAHAHQLSLRMAVAHLWSGIESIFGIEAELRFRVSMYVAALLEPRGPERIATYKRVKQLYNVRSKAVHGAKIDDAALKEHLTEVRALLCRIIRTCVETQRAPSEADLDEALLG